MFICSPFQGGRIKLVGGIAGFGAQHGSWRVHVASTPVGFCDTAPPATLLLLLLLLLGLAASGLVLVVSHQSKAQTPATQ